jgi:hypothetical protein
MPNGETKSSLVEAIEKRERPMWAFEAQNFLQRGFPRMGKYRIRVAFVEELDDALVMAHKYVAEKAKDSPEAARDGDLLGNAKVAYAMHAACRDFERDLPAFPSGRWLLKNTTTDELAVLLNHYQEVLKLAGPIDLDLSTERVEGLAALLATHADSDAPNMILMSFTREQVCEIAIRLSLLLREARAGQSQPE